MSKQIYIDSNGNEILVSGTVNSADMLPIETGSGTNTKAYIDDGLDKKVSKAYVGTIKVKSSSPAQIGSIGAYASFIFLGFCQGIGQKAILVLLGNNTISSVIDLQNGSAFSNSNLSFSYSSATRILTVSSSNASESSYTYIVGGIVY